MEAKFLSTKEASEIMDLSDKIVRELCREGKLLGAYQPGKFRPWKIPESSVLEWINSEKSGEQNELQENSLPTDVTRKSFYERKWFMATAAIVVLLAGIVGFLADSGIGKPFAFLEIGGGEPKYECNLDPPVFVEGKFGILIADFTNGPERNPSREGQELAERTYQALSTRLQTSTSVDNVETGRACFISDDAGAIEIAEISNASLIVWGNVPEFAEDIFTPSFLITDDPQLLIQGESVLLQSEIIGVTNADLPNRFSMRVTSAAAFMLGVYYLNDIGEFELAIREFTKAIQQTEPELADANPNSEQEVAMKRTLAVYYVLRGRSNAALGDTEQGLSDYQTAESIDNQYHGIFVGRGNYLYSIRDFASAEEQYQMALDRQEHASGYYGLANSLYYQLKIPQSIEYYKLAIEQSVSSENDPSLYRFVLATIYHEEKQNRLALEQLDQVISSGESEFYELAIQLKESIERGDEINTTTPISSPTLLPTSIHGFVTVIATLLPTPIPQLTVTPFLTPTSIIPTSTPIVTVTPWITPKLRIILESKNNEGHLILIVVEPSGDVLFGGNMLTDSDGRLDEDFDCTGSPLNMTWPDISEGRYLVKLAYSDRCQGPPFTDWRIIVQVENETIAEIYGSIFENQYILVFTLDGNTLDIDTPYYVIMTPKN